MRRPLWLRSLIAVWALWLGAVILGPAELHACPSHGNHAAHTSHAAASDGDMSAMPGMDHSSPQSAPSHDAKGQCNCVGACCFAPTVAPPSATIALVPIDEAVSATPAVPAPDQAAPAAAPPYALPFANGPPARA